MKLLLEFIVKKEGRYFIHSHKDPSKVIGKKIGYKTLTSAVYGLFILTTHGGFHNYSKDKQTLFIKNYIKRHKLRGKK